MKINQIYHHFSKWEDYKYGFYNSSCENIKEHIEKSIKLLSCEKTFYKYAKEVIENWVFSCEQNLTDPSLNKIAYIGQSACCYANKTPSFVTRLAWSYIDEDKQAKANKVAQKIIKEWQIKHINKGSLWEKLD